MGLIGLEHVAPAKRAQDTEDREHDGEELAPRQAKLGKAFRDIVHRTAGDGAVLVFVTVLHPERAFGELGRHAEQAGQDHPECRAGTADADSNRHPGDVAKSHGSRQSGGERLEMADLARILRVRIIALHQTDGMAEEPELHEAEIDGEDRGRHDQPQHDPGEAGSRQRREDEIDERPCHGREDFIDLLVKGHGFLRLNGARRPGRGECQQQHGFDRIHDCPLS